METCRAAVITEHNKPLTIERVPIPDLDPGLVVDQDHRHPRFAAPTCTLGMVPFHRAIRSRSSPVMSPAGYVEDIAGERTDILGNPVKRGDRVVWSYVACGSCYYCAVALQPCICPRRASWGHNRSDQASHICSAAVPSTCTFLKSA
jgi:Zn-dependent alcohol dehydrogenase